MMHPPVRWTVGRPRLALVLCCWLVVVLLLQVLVHQHHYDAGSSSSSSSSSSSLYHRLAVHAAHSRRRIVSFRPSSSSSQRPRYDRSVTTFDPSGRLLQVEYGMEASRRGTAFLAAIIDPGDGDSDGCTGIIVTASSSSESSATAPASALSKGGGPLLLHGANHNHNKVHRLAPHIFLITAGLSGDARALASILRSYAQGHIPRYGESPTVEQVARRAAELQHELTRSGGARPLGCTDVVIGVDPGDNRQHVRLFRTDPGGGMDECRYAAGGGFEEAILTEVGRQAGDLWGRRGDGEEADVHALTNVTEAAARLVQAFARAHQLGSGDASQGRPLVVDVWTIRPAPSRRGGLQVTCYWNVTASTPEPFLEALVGRR